LKKYESVIPTKDPDNVGNALRIDWKKFTYPMLLHPLIPLILKTIQKFANKGSKAILIVPKWKGQVWSAMVEEFTMSRITLGDAENVLIPGKNMGKRNMFLPPGKLKSRLLMNISNNIGGSLLQAFNGGKPFKNLLFLELKLLKDLENIPQKWMLILEMLAHEMGLRKLDLFISGLAESTQRSYKGGWSHFVSFFIEVSKLER
jgi:hypothetical protein